ncbi:hypothetical protein COMNV_01194 [Commensalibacter sp. Nvir]|uniref:DciA family protein n=1 Tax=Commensalibacter sp. Nvir TaxID=3069817 RepID=UPI002D3417E7|nr:hypothetical protein COMNV_01194 [Commensalibacter sp. Nvir]
MHKVDEKTVKKNICNNSEEVGNNYKEKRSYGLYQVGGCVHQITRSVYKHQSPLQSLLFHDWETIVGSHYGTCTVPHKLYSGTLTIACSNITATEIQYITQAFIQKINLYCGQPLVKRLKFLYSKTATPSSRNVANVSGPKVEPVHVANLPDGSLHKALALLGGHILNKTKGN